MVCKKYKIMNIEEGDLIFLVIIVLVNMEVIIVDILNELVCVGVYIILNNKKIYVLSYGCMEELKMMLNIMKFEYFVFV